MRKIWILGVVLLFHYSLFSQSNLFEGKVVENFKKDQLNNEIINVDVYQFDAMALHDYISNFEKDQQVQISFGKDYNWTLELYPMDIYSETASIRVLTESGEMAYPVPRNISFYGQITGLNHSRVLLILHGNHMSGYIDDGENRILIEPANKRIHNAKNNVYLVYNSNASIDKSGSKCGSDEYKRFESILNDKKLKASEKSVGACYNVELGIASDYEVYQDEGSTIQGVVDHLVTVMADVATNYEYSGSTNFDDGLEFEVVEQVISICSDCDRWTNSTDAGDVLDSFTAWGQNSGFNKNIDMGSFWTGRNFNGSTKGLAWTGGNLLCNGSAFHVLENFTNDADLLRVMTAHEMGHNLSALHASGSSYIMSATLNNTTTWASSSKSSISSEIADQGPSCMTTCGGSSCDGISNLVISNITANGFDVDFDATTEDDYRIRVRNEDDLTIIHTESTSSNSVTITPAQYEVCQVYEVIVENKCGGNYSGATSTLFQSPVSQGCSDFSGDKLMDWNSLSVSFTDNSTNASSWFWDFGDGNTSTQQNPSHTYTNAGYYTVSLEINGGAHTNTKNDYTVVLPEVSVPYGLSDGGDMEDEDFGAVCMTDGEEALWERGVASHYFTNSTNAWVTDLDADVSSADNMSILYAPKFDFSGQGTYTFSFDLGMNILFCNAPYGVKIEYSTDDGSNWNRLGSDTDSGWYNRGPSKGCSIAQSIYTDEMGWTFNGQGTNYSYDVSFLSGNPGVAFRFVFNMESGWSGSGYRAGAIIDNITMDASLPVELLSFDGKVKSKAIELEWKTINEVNNDYFIVEKSYNGKDFFEITQVEGNGTTYQMSSYSAVDNNPDHGINYYRLTQYDFQGSYKTYEVLAIAYGSETAHSFYPNPARGHELNLNYLSGISSDLHIELMDLTGMFVMERNLSASKGINQYTLDISSLQSGVYLVRLNGEIKDKLVITK